MKGLIKKIIIHSGSLNVLKSFNKTPRILFYHGVEPTKNLVNNYVQSCHIDSDSFYAQMRYLKRKNYDVITLDALNARISADSLKGNEIVLTFDDGYKNNLYVVAPMLKEFNFPFSVYISTRHIEEGIRFPTFIVRAIVSYERLTEVNLPSITYSSKLNLSNRKMVANEIISIIKGLPEPKVKLVLKELIGSVTVSEYDMLCDLYQSDAPMNWEEVKELLKYDCVIGSHCVDHFICHNKQEEAELEYQLSESRSIIRELQGHCDYLAYPNGGKGFVTDNAIKIAEKIGYKMALSTNRIHIKNVDKINRFLMPRYLAYYNPDSFKIHVSR